MKRKFPYRRPTPLSGWGYRFDSMTEVKFALSIMEDYAFTRSPVSMYFHPGTIQLAPHPGLFHRRYTPDFLIRHLDFRQAFLIEIKPRAFENQTELGHHRKVANDYIRSLKLDWTYQVVFDDEIILDETQLASFQECLSLKPEYRFAWFESYVRKMSAAALRLPNRPNAHIDFLMRGWQTGQPNLFTGPKN